MGKYDNLLGELQEILFGKMRTVILQEKLKKGQTELFDSLWNIPDSPAQYLASKQVLFQSEYNNGEALERDRWLPFYYMPVWPVIDEMQMPARITRVYTYCECNLLLIRLNQWIQELEPALLGYTLVELQEGLIAMLQEIRKRGVRKLDKPSKEISFKIMEDLFCGLTAFLFDMQLRYGHLMQGRTLSYHKLFHHIGAMQVPENPILYMSKEGAEYFLEKEPVTKTAIQTIEQLLAQHYRLIKASPKPVQKKVLPALDALEAGWLLGKVHTTTDGALPPEQHTFSGAGAIIQAWAHRLYNNTASEQLATIIFALKSEAAEIPLFENKQHSNVVRELLVDNAQNTSRVQEEEIIFDLRKRTSGNPFDEYMHLHELEKDLGVTRKSLVNYLDKAGVETVSFSQKTQMVHKKEVEKFISFFKKEHKNE